jgi:hypothetical protein
MGARLVTILLTSIAGSAIRIDDVYVVESMSLSELLSQVRKTPSWPRSWANFSLF